MPNSAPPALDFRLLGTPEEAEACARMMASSEPWLTLGRSFEESRKIILDPTREVWVVDQAGHLAGFLILNLRGAFTGYIQTICVDPTARGAGLGTKLIEFAEQRVFADSPNVFLCVSTFNTRARALYERLGYETIGTLKDYLVRGYDEILMRKTIGPIAQR